MANNLAQYINDFAANAINGQALLQLDSAKLKVRISKIIQILTRGLLHKTFSGEKLRLFYGKVNDKIVLTGVFRFYQIFFFGKFYAIDARTVTNYHVLGNYRESSCGAVVAQWIRPSDSQS